MQREARREEYGQNLEGLKYSILVPQKQGMGTGDGPPSRPLNTRLKPNNPFHAGHDI